MIKAIIIDDERNSRDIIALMLERYCPDIKIVAMAGDCADGISKIMEHHPSLVFLDLEMPDGTGFDVLAGTLPHLHFEAVFVTAFEKKFIHIIRFSDVELILKPIDKEGLLQAVNLITERITSNNIAPRYEILLENYNNQSSSDWKMLLMDINGQFSTINIDDISWLESVNEHTLFGLKNKPTITSVQPFRYYAELFIPLHFYQINNTQMIQLSSIQQIDSNNSKILMNSGHLLDITERRQKDLLQKLGQR
ncbi:response regulator [Chitinophaga silvatica]|uniref:Response regulator n=1 Tax=Chitinophaga silvatica TaxID=2282649 RepID=A0A3E1YCP4_9BACT|nr:response regulator [Chitinophaga silvatica]RFS24028.1 response regulator [Chitinophaga silvatica]